MRIPAGRAVVCSQIHGFIITGGGGIPKYTGTATLLIMERARTERPLDYFWCHHFSVNELPMMDVSNRRNLASLVGKPGNSL